MAKIVLTTVGKPSETIDLSKARITIGRRSNNDIVIDDPAVSSQHAVIVTASGDCYLEDLNSTNGSRIQGRPIKRHSLRDNDVVELAQYQLRYIADEPVTVGLASQPVPRDAVAAARPFASIKVRNDTSEGTALVLNKALTTIGKPGLQLAIITRDHRGYSITHLEGSTYPLVNGQSIGTGRHSMKDGDVIDLIGATMEFATGTDN